MSEPVGLAGDRLRSFVERIEHIEEEIKGLSEGKKEVYAEAKGEGFDVKVYGAFVLDPDGCNIEAVHHSFG